MLEYLYLHYMAALQGGAHFSSIKSQSSPAISSMHPSSHLLPLVPAFDISNWSAVRKAMTNGLSLPLGQSWLKEPESRFSPGMAHLACSGNNLFVYANFHDDHPFNRASKRNDRTWEMGDLLEIILRKDDSPDYYEFHITPENQRLQLHYPSDKTSRGDLPINTWMVEKDLFASWTKIDPSDTNWEVLVRIDFDVLFKAKPSTLHFLIGRYDTQPGQSAPVISSTAHLSKCAFHNAAEWSRVEVPGH